MYVLFKLLLKFYFFVYLFLFFSSLTMKCQVVVFFVFLLFGFCWTSGFYVFHHIWKIMSIISLNISSTLFFLLHWEVIPHFPSNGIYVKFFNPVPDLFCFLFCFSSLFALCFNLVISINPPFCSLSLSSAVPGLLLNTSSDFLF